MQFTAIFTAVKIKNVQLKKCDVFVIFAQNIDCVRFNEATLRGTQNHCFKAEIRQKINLFI